MRVRIAAACCAAVIAIASGDAGAEPARDHVVFVELFGKAGLWGLGYDYRLAPKLEVGAVASYAVVDGQRISSLAPFVLFAPLGGERHRWYVDVGSELVHVATPSPVPEWMGTSTSGIATELSIGYEYRGPFVLRAFAMVSAGRGGVAPWFGIDLGWSL